MNSALSNVAAFKAQLDKLGCDFLCNTPLPNAIASVSFLGSFQGLTVRWNMTLVTLANYRVGEVNVGTTSDQNIFCCPFIEIKEGVEDMYQIKVGLDLEIIDESVIKKTIIMIRNYKRLAIGLNEFGSMHT